MERHAETCFDEHLGQVKYLDACDVYDVGQMVAVLKATRPHSFASSSRITAQAGALNRCRPTIDQLALKNGLRIVQPSLR